MSSSKSLHYLSQYVSDTKAIAYYTSNVNIVYNTITSTNISNITYNPVYTYNTLYSYINKTSNLFNSNIKIPYNEIVNVNEMAPQENASTADYFYYSFTDTSINANNYMTFSSNTVCDILIVGGGGSGAKGLGGGSSGGLLYAKGISIPAGEYPITIGAGGINDNGGYSSAFGATAYGGMKATTATGATKYLDNDITGSIISTTVKNSAALAGGTSQYTYQGLTPYAYNTVITATGATAQQVSDNSNYYYYAFTTTGSGNSISFTKDVTCDIFMIGGGGGGGYNHGGGGGAGAYFLDSKNFNSNINYTITIGKGGNGSTSSTVFPLNGDDTKISNGSTNILLVRGGGGGAHGNNYSDNGNDGGCGGGAGWGSSTVTGGSSSNIGTDGIGFNGGSKGGTNGYAAGGGGGIGSVGQDNQINNGGNGGDGKIISIKGINEIYGGGGGGGCHSSDGANNIAGLGGGAILNGVYTRVGGNAADGDGGNGAQWDAGGNGITNTGSGGGSGKAWTGGIGGSGIVIIRVPATILVPSILTSNLSSGGGGIGSAGETIMASSSEIPTNGGSGFQVSIRKPNEYFAGGGGANGGKRIPSIAYTIGYGGNSSELSGEKGGDGIVIVSVPFSKDIGNIYNINTLNNLPTSSTNLSYGFLNNPSYYYYAFTDTSKTNYITFYKNTICDILIVGGGGSGAIGLGGGSSGGLLYSSNIVIPIGEYPITVGAGGINGNGGGSIAFGATAYGGMKATTATGATKYLDNDITGSIISTTVKNSAALAGGTIFINNTTNLMVWYKFSGTNGITDSSTNNKNAIATGTPVISNNIINITQPNYLQLPSNIIDFNNDITICFWYRFDNSAHSAGRLIEFQTILNRTSHDNGIFICRNLTNSLYFIIDTKADISINFGHTTSGEMIHLTWVIKKNGIWNIYKNGVSVFSQQCVYPKTNIYTYSYLGKSLWSGEFSNDNQISLKDLRVYNRTLTLDEIALLYNNISSSVSGGGGGIGSSPQISPTYTIERKYPPIGLILSSTTEQGTSIGTKTTKTFTITDKTTVYLTTQGINYGGGDYIIDWSSQFSTPETGLKCFTGTTGETGWHGKNYYSGANFTYLFTDIDSITSLQGTVYKGDWIKIKLPKLIHLSSVKFWGRSGGTTQLPKDITVLGSIDGSSWKEVIQKNNCLVSPFQSTINDIVQIEGVYANSISYNYYVLIITKLYSNTYVCISEIEFYGKEILTLGSIHNGGQGFPISIRTPNELFAGGGGGNGGKRIPETGYTIGYGGNSSSTSAENGGDGIVIIKFAAEIEEENPLKIINNITGSSTTILDNDLTPNKVVITDSIGKITTFNDGSLTNFEYLSGLQYNIKQQFIDTSNYADIMSNNINSNILNTSNEICKKFVNINTYLIDTSNNLLSNINSLNLENINVIANTKKIIINNTYDCNLKINATLTVNSDLNVSGTSTQVYAPIFNTEALEINSIISLPTPLLTVNYTGTSNILEIYSNTSIKAVVSKDGYLGIGNTIPQYSIDVSSNINISGNYKINGTNLSYYNMSNIPLTFNPSIHNHNISDITDLQTQLDNKYNLFSYITSTSDTITINADVNLTTGNKYTSNGIEITTKNTIQELSYIAPIIIGTNAISINNTTYQYVAFTSINSENKITFLQDTICDILVIGGGGGGGSRFGGGGGAGGVSYYVNQTLNGTYNIIIGDGGNGGIAIGGGGTSNAGQGTNGYNSLIQKDDINTYIGYGGGGGGKGDTGNGLTGGSGGGASGRFTGTGGSTNQGNTYWNGESYVVGGYSGGSYDGSVGTAGAAEYTGAGGGGAGGLGYNSEFSLKGINGKGRGGIGIQNSITGLNRWYAGGGGGGNDINGTTEFLAAGGLGGGGTGGGKLTFTLPTAGQSNTGGGGGGGIASSASYTANLEGAKGGSGIVIIRWNTLYVKPKTWITNINKTPIINTYNFYNETSNLLVWYKFDQIPSNNLTLINYGIGNGTSSTYNGTVIMNGTSEKTISQKNEFYQDTSNYNWSITMEATSENYITINNAPQLLDTMMNSDYSISFWKTSYDASIDYSVYARNDSTIPATDNLNIFLRIHSPSNNDIVYFDNGGFSGTACNRLQSSAITNYIGIRKFYTFTRKITGSNEILSAYINGILLISASYNLLRPSVSSLAQFYIGLNKNATFAFKNKSIGDFRIYNRVITTAEMGDLYNIARKTQFVSIPKQINNYTSYYEFKTPVGQINTLTKYPREPMTAETFTYKDGTIVNISASSAYNDATHKSWNSFSGTTNDVGWGSEQSCYIQATGISVNERVIGYKGEWLKIDLGENIMINSFKIYQRTDIPVRMPKIFRFYASNDINAYNDVNHANWKIIYEDTGSYSSSSSIRTCIIGSTVSYRYFFIVINAIYGAGVAGDTIVQFAELEIYGFPTKSITTIQYPRFALTGNTTTVNNITVNTKTSSQLESRNGWKLFDRNTEIGNTVNTGWTNSTGNYTANSGGATYTGIELFAVNEYYGEWIMIDLGEQTVISQMKLWRNINDAGFFTRHPRNYRLYGSNDITAYNKTSENWTQIFDKIDKTASPIPLTSNPTNDVWVNTLSFRYYALVINRIYDTAASIVNGGYVEFYELQLFNRSSSYIFKTNTITFEKDTVCDVLVVGGGGSGGIRHAGGGGAGACIYKQNYTFTKGKYDIIIGDGGESVPNTTNAIGNHGKDSYIQKNNIDIFRAIGGSGGGFDGANDILAGGSTGGASASKTTSENISLLNIPLSGDVYGNKGGVGLYGTNAFYAGGGGGGASGIGGNAFSYSASLGYGGAGGDGKLINIIGRNLYYAGGGGGGIGPTGIGGQGGSGIGGNGSATTSSALNGKANTGSGGGGGGFTGSANSISGAGGSGIVIIKWNNFTDNSHINYNDADIYNNNIIIGETKYLDNVNQYGNIRKYPPAALTTVSTLEFSQTLSLQNYGNGEYTVSQSSYHSATNTSCYPYIFFNGIDPDGQGGATSEVSDSTKYSQPLGHYIGINSINNYFGEWIKLKIPVKIYLAYIKIYTRNGLFDRAPSIYRVYGSNDDIKWTLLIDNNIEANYINYSTTNTILFHTSTLSKINQLNNFQYFVLCVNKIKGGSATATQINFSELEFYGSETYSKIDTISNYDFYNDTTDMKVWYKLEDLNDSSGNGLTITNSGATFDTAIGNYATGTGAIKLGTSAFAYVKSPSDNYFTPNTSFTFSFWLKSNNNSTNHQVIVNSRNNTVQGWNVVRLQDYNSIYFEVFKSSGTGTRMYDVGSSWNHIVCVLEYVSTTQQNMSLYMNGIFKEIKSGNIYDFNYIDGALYFGKSATGTPYNVADNTFIDDFRMYNRVLTFEEIQILYYRRKINDRTVYSIYNDNTNLALQYDFDSTNINDLTNIYLNKGYLGTAYNLTITGTLQSVSGAINLNNNSYLTINTVLDTTGWTECSICFRLKRTALNTSGDVIFYHTSGQTFVIQRNAATSTWSINIFGSGVVNTTTTTLNDFIIDNIWNHYVFVFNKEGTQVRIKIYKNGVFDPVFTNLSGTWTTGISNVIMSYTASTATLKGLLDDVRIYNRILTTDEIQTLNDMIYNKIDKSDYIFNGSIDYVSNTSNSLIIPTGNIVAYTGDIITESGNINTNNLFINQNLIINTSIRDYSSNILTKFPKNPLTSISSSVEKYINPSINILAWYKFDGNLLDSSGNDRHLTGGTGTSFVSDCKLGNSSISFPNTATQTVSSSTLSLAGNISFTISLWSKRTTAAKNDCMVCAGTTVSQRQLLLLSYLSTDYVQFSFYSDDLNTANTYTDVNTWVHWTFVYNGTTKLRQIYRNGILENSGTAAGNTNFAATFNIGNRTDVSNNQFSGLIDDVRVFNRDLTPEEIATIYNINPTYNIYNTNKLRLGWDTGSIGLLTSGNGTYPYLPSISISYKKVIFSGDIIISDGTVATAVTVNGKIITIPSGYQIWTVPISGSYKLVAGGARGRYKNIITEDGKGIVVSNTVQLIINDKIIICVGKTSKSIKGDMYSGGGGTFISKLTGLGSNNAFTTTLNHTLLLVAGGGGGWGEQMGTYNTTNLGMNAVLTTSGTLANGAGSYGFSTTTSSNGGGGGGKGGAGGNAVNGLDGSGTDGSGAGGGGFIGDGGIGTTNTGGKSFLNGGQGGDTPVVDDKNTYGGFGGGGGSWNAGGGGGGYSGGNAAKGTTNTHRSGGGGGGSYDINGTTFNATQYTIWNLASISSPSQFLSGYSIGDGFVAIEQSTYSSTPVSTTNYVNNSGTIIYHNGVLATPLQVPGSTDFYFAFTSTSGPNSIKFNKNTICDVLVVGGGGAGGNDTGGGGGGGEVIYYTDDNIVFKTGSSCILQGTYDITVGTGGTSTSGIGNQGSISKISINAINLLVAGGGGSGGSAHVSTKPANSTGGGGGGNAGTSSDRTGASSTTNGGNGGTSVRNLGGGGGGGANISGTSKNGNNASESITGNGGAGVNIYITGNELGVGGGGSGGTYQNFLIGTSSHGGGTGGTGAILSTSGINGTGGGGGGKGYSGYGNSSGGSGIVIIRWREDYDIIGTYPGEYLKIDMGEYILPKYIAMTPVINAFYTNTNNLKIWYKFDNNLTDSSGNGLTMIKSANMNYSTISQITGTSSLEITTSPSYAYSSNISTNYFTPTNDFSISFWLYKVNSGSSYEIIATTRNTGINNKGGWSILGYGTSIICETYKTSGAKQSNTVNVGIGWVHITFVLIYTSSTLSTYSLYINGILQIASANQSGDIYCPQYNSAIGDEGNKLYLGSERDGSSLPCTTLTKFDDFRIYNRSLTLNEISILSNINGSLLASAPAKVPKNFRLYGSQNIYGVIIYQNGVLATPLQVSGSTDYYFAFTSTTGINSITFTKNTTCDILVVAGGGGGGQNGGGGGGAGGYLYYTNILLNGFCSITIGNGGVGAIHSPLSASQPGGNSTFVSGSILYTAIGGGGGNGRDVLSANKNGGSGGGGGGTTGTAAGTGTAGPPIQGYNGGNGFDSAASSAGGGGGGAGGVATTGASLKGGDGGIGISNNISGTYLYYSGGGAGADTLSGSIGNAGLGSERYGGGGNGGRSGANGLSGLSGIVIIRWRGYEEMLDYTLLLDNIATSSTVPAIAQKYEVLATTGYRYFTLIVSNNWEGTLETSISELEIYGYEQSYIYVKYPRQAMTANTLAYTDGSGVIVNVTGSTFTTDATHYYWNSFSGTIGDYGWGSEASKYTPATGVSAIAAYRTGYAGEYIMIDLGEQIMLNNIKIYPRKDSSCQYRTPKDFKIFVSNSSISYGTGNQNNGWTEIYTGSASGNGSQLTPYSYIIGSITPYRYYMMVINKIFINAISTMVQFAELELYGLPGNYIPSASSSKWRISTTTNDELNFSTSTDNEINWITRSMISATATGGYTNFTGIHHCRGNKNELYNEMYIGRIVSSTKKYSNINSIYGIDNIKRNLDKTEWNYLPIVELSSKENDKNVFGIITKIEDINSKQREYQTGFMKHYYDKEEFDRRLHIASTGEGGIWICNYNNSIIESGDYISSSSILGFGMKQSDDLQHNYTVAKATMDCDFNPKLLPVKIIATSNILVETKEDEPTIIRNIIIDSFNNEIFIPYIKINIKFDFYNIDINNININNISNNKYDFDTSYININNISNNLCNCEIINLNNYNIINNIDIIDINNKSNILYNYNNIDNKNNNIYYNVYLKDENEEYIYTNLLDDNDNIIYEYEYELKYINANGEFIEKETYDKNTLENINVYKAAFIGCSYHC